MPLRITIKVDDSGPQRRLRGMTRRMRNFKPVFRWAFKELQLAHRLNFQSKGAVGGQVWAPLDPEYAAWKLENYGANGILVRTGDLQRSLTFDNARGAVREIRRTKARFGTSIPYARFHQTGTRNMPERPPIVNPEVLQSRLADRMATYIVEGRGVERATGAFRRRSF